MRTNRNAFKLIVYLQECFDARGFAGFVIIAFKKCSLWKTWRTGKVVDQKYIT